MNEESPTSGSVGEILNIRQVAAYLMVSEKTIYRMVEKKQIPAVRVSAQWRFRRSDIEAWLSEQVHRVEYEGKREVVDEITSEDISIAPLLQPENIWVGLSPVGRDELLATMVRSASLDPHVDRERLLESILERERVCSTALLDAVALPHPMSQEEFRFPRKRFLIATLKGPIDFADPHGHRPVVVVILLARSLQGHLLALSRAIKLFGNPELLAQLKASESPIDVVARIHEHEARLGRQDAAVSARAL
jgi:PTS system nitrogen regulatory IIA component